MVESISQKMTISNLVLGVPKFQDSKKNDSLQKTFFIYAFTPILRTGMR